MRHAARRYALIALLLLLACLQVFAQAPQPKPEPGTRIDLAQATWENGLTDISFTQEQGAQIVRLAPKSPTAPVGETLIAVDQAAMRNQVWRFKAAVASDSPAVLKVTVKQSFPHLAMAVSRFSPPIPVAGGNTVAIDLPFFAPADVSQLSVSIHVTQALPGAALTIKNPVLISVDPVVASRTTDPDFERALDTIKSKAWRTGAVNWPAVQTLAYQLLDEPATPESRRQALEFVLSALADGHSFVIRPRTASATPSASAPAASLQAAFVREDFSAGHYLKPAPIASMQADESRRYASQLAGAITSAPASTCGWVVDLRRNPGGNMYPALDGLWHFFGDGPLGQFLSANGNSGWSYTGGSSSRQEPVSGGPARFKNAPVAVLIDKSSWSSAEALAISFIGRDNTRLFGSRSGGYTTGNQVVQVNDQLRVALASVMLADLSGRSFPLGIDPDVKVEASTSSPGEDPARQQAQAWVTQQCSASK